MIHVVDTPTLLEEGFPAQRLTAVLDADRRVRDPRYAAHRWWARRPPALMRAILIAATLPADAVDEFWSAFGSPAMHLDGVGVYDPFMGGGTTLVEAARMGANVAGTDVDPISFDIVSHALSELDGKEILAAGQRMLTDLTERFGHLYPDNGSGEPLHYFWLHEVTCPHCGTDQALHRSRVVARDAGKSGGVVRDYGLVVFDPHDDSIVHLRDPERQVLNRNGKRIRLRDGNFDAGRFTCGECGLRSTHADLKTGISPRRLLAIEHTPPQQRRHIDEPASIDLEAIDQARVLLSRRPAGIVLPEGEFSTDRRDNRPRSFGITKFEQLYTDRQLLVLGAAWSWVRNADLADETRAGLTLAISNALTTNNKLCSYATDYGRLSALFSVRGYSLPWMPVELNPLHTSAGRGTLLQCLRRVARSSETQVRRNVWNPESLSVRARVLDLPPQARSVNLRCGSAADVELESAVDLLVFDPPYFDLIDYDELAEIFRSWRSGYVLGGATLQSTAHDAPGRFGASLAKCLEHGLRARRPGLPIAFTYHSSKSEAWEAIGVALDEAKLRVTALWPVRSDGHMGHHSHPGNCEWDVVVVARPVVETYQCDAPAGGINLISLCGNSAISQADASSLENASATMSTRWGRVRQND